MCQFLCGALYSYFAGLGFYSVLEFGSLHFKASYISQIMVLCTSVMSTHCFSIIFRDLSQRGLTCQVLNLRSSHFRKLNMVGKFIHLRSLNLDFSSSLTSLRKDCFTCMPNLNCLSLCETRIANLWTTSSALLKLDCIFAVMQGKGAEASMFVQSLRGDPFRVSSVLCQALWFFFSSNFKAIQ